MHLTDHQFDNLEALANRRFDRELDQYLHDRFPDVGASAFGELRSKCAVACQRWKILSGEGIFAFHEASFVLGEPLDHSEEYRIALTRAVLIGWTPDQVAIDLVGMLR